VHNDDISNVLILNKKSITNQENQLFKAELEKFRPHQNRLLQANHKQASLMKELTRTYSDLLQDKRVRSEQSKYEAFSRQRNTVITKYRKVYQAFNDLVAGLMRAQGFYSEMKETVASLQKNVETFVNNRRSEGGQLLSAIEAARSSSQAGLVDWERERLTELMERMSTNPSNMPPSPASKKAGAGAARPPPLQQASSYQQQPAYNTVSSPPPAVTQYVNAPPPTNQWASLSPPPRTGYMPPSSAAANGSSSYAASPGLPGRDAYTQGNYNPNNYGQLSPPAHSQYFSPPPTGQVHSQSHGGLYSPPPPGASAQQGQQQQQQPLKFTLHQGHQQQHQQQQQTAQQQVPPGWQPPPPPPGPPPAQDFGVFGGAGQYPSGPGGYAQHPGMGGRGQGMGQGREDPWRGLEGWK